MRLQAAIRAGFSKTSGQVEGARSTRAASSLYNDRLEVSSVEGLADRIERAKDRANAERWP